MRTVIAAAAIALTAASFLGACVVTGWASGLTDVSGAMMGLAVGLALLSWATVLVLVVFTMALIAAFLEDAE